MLDKAWTKEKPKFPGLYKWRTKSGSKYVYGYILLDVDGFYYDLALGLLRRFSLTDSKRELRLINRSGGDSDEIVQINGATPRILNMVKP